MLRQTHVGSSRRFAHLSLRLLLLLIGMFTAALGVALTTVADLGTTPISTVPYVFTVLTGYSFGTTTFFVNLFLVAGQVLAPSSSVFALESSANTDCSHFWHLY